MHDSIRWLDNISTDIKTNGENFFDNGFEQPLLRIVTEKNQTQFDFSNYITSNLSIYPVGIINGYDIHNKSNLWIHLRISNGQLQIRFSNKINGQWKVGQWQDVYNKGLTTLHW